MHIFCVRNQMHLNQPRIVHLYYLVYLGMDGDGSFLIPFKWQKLKRGFQIRFLPVFQRKVGSQSKLCFRALKSSLGLKFKASARFKGKSKTLIWRNQANVQRALVWFKLYPPRTYNQTTPTRAHGSCLAFKKKWALALNYEASYAW